MATSKEYRDFIIDQSGLGEEIMTRQMMDEYLLYYCGKHVGGIYDNRLLLKKTKTNGHLGMPEATPYPGAKPMLQVDSDDRDEVREAILATADGVSVSSRPEPVLP